MNSVRAVITQARKVSQKTSSTILLFLINLPARVQFSFDLPRNLICHQLHMVEIVFIVYSLALTIAKLSHHLISIWSSLWLRLTLLDLRALNSCRTDRRLDYEGASQIHVHGHIHLCHPYRMSNDCYRFYCACWTSWARAE